MAKSKNTYQIMSHDDILNESESIRSWSNLLLVHLFSLIMFSLHEFLFLLYVPLHPSCDLQAHDFVEINSTAAKFQHVFLLENSLQTERRNA